MSATEINNLVLAQCSFTATDPPVLYRRNANVRGVSRSSAGVYVIDLVNKLSGDGALETDAQIIAIGFSALASFTQALGNAGGDIVVQTKVLAGTAGDTSARVEVLVLAYPTTT